MAKPPLISGVISLVELGCTIKTSGQTAVKICEYFHNEADRPNAPDRTGWVLIIGEDRSLTVYKEPSRP